MEIAIIAILVVGGIFLAARGRGGSNRNSGHGYDRDYDDDNRDDDDHGSSDDSDDSGDDGGSDDD